MHGNLKVAGEKVSLNIFLKKKENKKTAPFKIIKLSHHLTSKFIPIKISMI